MQYVKNDLIIHLIYGLKNNICQNQLHTKNMINLKNRGPRSKLPHWTKIIYSYVTIMCTNKKITCICSQDTRCQNRYYYWPGGNR